MAIRDYRGREGLDEYLHNEYRAEEGAYLERRPAYEQYGDRGSDTRFWGPRIPEDYFVDEAYTRTGTGAPLGAPWPGTDYAPEYPLRGEGPYDRSYDRREHRVEPRRPRSPARHHQSGDAWQRDRQAGRSLVHAAEHFYEDLAGSVGLEPREGEPRHHRGRGPRNYRRSDERIADDIHRLLTDDPYVDASEVEVIVKNQEVTLSGTVPTRFEKRQAEDLAEAVSGVTHVQNNLRVQPPGELRR
ncbi:BON domain-containing protein [Microvirga roseola]|uniref:BON domain-containing protein n=1 Tax=Microvirga roseola TaxID=2883126 RepID=UPI001E3CC272|nr:BON domain-containing protein [Microvirga roseola]